MKKGLVSSLILAAISLTSCSFSQLKVIEKDISVYDIDTIQSDGQLADAFQTTVKAAFKEGEELIPYLTLKQYASLYESHFASDVKSEIVNYGYITSWMVYKGESPVFAAQFSNVSKEIMIGGNLQAAYEDDDDPRDLKALDYGLKNDGKALLIDGNGMLYYSYANYGISSFKYNEDRYYPLGLLDLTFTDSSSIYFTYNYKHIISTRDTDNYAEKYYYDEGTNYSFDTQMEAIANNAPIPSYLLKYNAGLFLYTMDNLYGLKDYKGIKSFTSYYKSKGFYNGLFSKDGSSRPQAYADALAILDDGHTALVSTNKAWGDSDFQRRRYGEATRSRGMLKTTLEYHRTQAYNAYDEHNRVVPEKDILYSSDGKTALFSFDSFAFGTSSQVFNDDDTIKDSAKTYDTFFKLIDAFDRMKAKGGVENVIIDISINGGGVVGILLKLLALISKDNTGYFCFYNQASGQASIYDSKVDSNGDGQYDVNDCYGNDFNFYILTSDYSYSCANAFPCLAQYQKTAKILGQKSGGGECAVAVHYLPNSEYVYHSSNLHIGYIDEEKEVFHGFEGGAIPDISIDINQDFYSVDNLNSIIKNA